MWGYKRRDPDPISPGLMAATPRPWMPRPLPRPRWNLLCALRGHKPFGHELRNRAEQWGVFAQTCKRCHNLIKVNAATRA